jgi:GntR family transcriptional regulator / MocR family aminotransferase
MPKRATPIVLMLPARDPGVPAHRWLATALRAEILEGRLRPGARLPATRDLARQYALSRGTIVAAFAQLEAEGYVAGTVGSGTHVKSALPDDLLEIDRRRGPRPITEPHPRRQLSAFARAARGFPGRSGSVARAFRANQPALDLFPMTLWTQVATRRLRRASTSLLLGSPPMGYPPLQQAIADYLATSRGVRCTPQQIAIVAGAQDALTLAARLVLDRGDRVCIEHPGYLGATLVFTAIGARIIEMPVDGEGMVLERKRARGVRLVYVTPSHQYPMGVTMSLPRRLELLEWARSTGALIFEDDYDAEFRYAGRPVPSMQGLDRHGVVLFSGSFSKVLFPSIRLGYLVVPADLVDRVSAIRALTTRHAPVLDQAILADFIVEGHFGRHLRRMREIYAERHRALLVAAREYAAGLLEVSGVEAGLQTMGWLPVGIDGEAISRAAAVRDVEVVPIARRIGDRVVQHGLQLGFAAVDETEIRRGMRDLAAVLKRRRAQTTQGPNDNG